MYPELAFRGLTFRYGRTVGRPALDGASAIWQGGRTIALLGPNGAGKSTLCKVLNGVLAASAGSISLGGEPIRPHRQPGAFVAYSFQNPDDQLFLSSVREELAFGPRNVGMDATAVREAVAQALDLFGLGDVAGTHPLDLPFSLRKRVALAGAVAMSRPWLVLDEPTLGQDPGFSKRLIEVTKHLKSQGQGLIIISHDPEFTFEVCDSILLLTDGRCARAGAVEQFLSAVPAQASSFVNLAGRLSADLSLSPVHATGTALLNYLRGRNE